MGNLLTIRCRFNGPFVVEILPDASQPSPGDHSGEMGTSETAGSSPVGPSFQVIDHEGRAFVLPAHKRAVALCRCGQSRTRPFCDGSHKEAGFEARETADRRPP